MLLLGVLITTVLFVPASAWALCTGTGAGQFICSSATDLETMLENNSPAWRNGAIITVAPGTYTVDSQIYVDVGKNFTLRGGGVVTLLQGAGLTNIPMIRIETVPGSGPTRITGFIIDGNGVDNGNKGNLVVRGNSHQVRVDHNIFIQRGTSPMWFHDDVRGVFDHNTCVWPTGNQGICIYTMHERWDRDGDGVPDGSYGDSSWAADDTFGTEHAMYFEDNVFDYNHPSGGSGLNFRATTDGWQGQRVVYRFNHNRCSVYHNHGTESGLRGRSGRMIEAYHNTYETVGDCSIFTLVDVRGGSAFVFNNTGRQTGLGQIAGVKLKYFNVAAGGLAVYPPFGMCGQIETHPNYPLASITSSGSTATVTFTSVGGFQPADGWRPWWAGTPGAGPNWMTITGATQPNYNGTYKVTQISGTQVTYTCAGGANCGASPATGAIHILSPWHQNSLPSGGNCLDQPGMGKSAFLGDDGLEMPGNPTLPSGTQTNPVAGWPNQALLPSFAVNNLVNGSPVPMQLNGSSQSSFIIENKHYYTQKLPFTGATGIGYGTRSARPSTCTTGVLYFATDGGRNWNVANGPGADGGVDKCTATNTWTNDWYVPYTYPHPLIALTDGEGQSTTMKK